jgi:hypothetical protein
LAQTAACETKRANERALCGEQRELPPYWSKAPPAGSFEKERTNETHLANSTQARPKGDEGRAELQSALSFAGKPASAQALAG